MSQINDKSTPSNAPNFLSLAVLFFGFSITLLSQQSLTNFNRNTAHVYFIGAGIFVILALLPHTITNFMKNKYIVMISYSAANLAWFFTFALKWLDGMKNTNDAEQILVSVVGFIFLIAIIVIETRYLKEFTQIREVGLVLPLVILIFGITSLVKSFDIWTLIYIMIFVVLGVLVVYTKWRPGGDLPFIPSNNNPRGKQG